ncbi:MAG TPA: hypothetical protein DD435_07660 [Cyanobacteria bacterium UBA8530]|nr:hypothetical protein [Cyanobacteria bacterium UBA8530]
MKNRLLVALAATTLGLSACGGNVHPTLTSGSLLGVRSQSVHKAGQAKWTLLLHMAADNDLDKFGIEDLNQMEVGLNNPDVNMIVLYDGWKRGDSCIYKIKHDASMNGEIVSEKLNDGGAIIDPSTNEIDSGDPKVSAKFAQWAVKQFPADRYGMTFWDHGSGLFDPKDKRPNPSRSFCIDAKGGFMRTSDLDKILASGVQAAGKPFDVLGFDACLMSHVEMAYQAKGLADFMIASQETEPAAGWDYINLLKALSANPDMDGAGLGKAAVETYVNSFKPGGSQNPTNRYLLATLSCTNIKNVVTKLTPALNDFARIAMAGYSANKAVLDAVRLDSNYFLNGDCPDLGDFLSKLDKSSVPTDIKAAGAAVEAARAGSVVAYGGVGDPKHVASTGLVIYFPSIKWSYETYYSDPSKIAFAAENWKNYLILTHSPKTR